MSTDNLTSAERFFFDQAGYGYDPKTETADEGRARGARDLAEAETWAKSVGLTFVWDYDQEVSYTDFEDESPNTVYETAAAFLNGTVVASLGAIGDASDEYRRVVNAELAMEAREWVNAEQEAARKLTERTNRKRHLAERVARINGEHLTGYEFLNEARELANLVLEDL